MGGQYRITGDKYPRMRRPRRRGRIVFAVVASVAALGVIGWGTLQLIDVFTGGSTTKAGGHGCAKPAPKNTVAALAAKPRPKPGDITVNVYNATQRSGLAKLTADELKKRGFAIGDVGNAPEQFDKKLKGVGILLGPKTSMDTALPVLGTQLAGAELRTDTRAGNKVDLILGDAFKELSKKDDADKAMTALSEPAPTTAKSKKKC
ncbi:LytR C-terminal domain-containing protein [Streptomyces sp. NPDC002004]